jgi:hypothetical protein
VAASDDLSPLLTQAGLDPDNAAHLRALCRILGCADEDRDTLTKRLNEVRALAFTEWIEWANAQRRFNTLSELDAFPVCDQVITDAKSDARRDFGVHLLLNIVAFIVNGAVLPAWWKVGVLQADCRQWEYWLPWAAVTLGFGALSVTAGYALVKLRNIGWPK